MTNKLRTTQITVTADPADSGSDTYIAMTAAETRFVVDTVGSLQTGETVKIDSEQITLGTVDATVGGCLVSRAAQGSTGATHVINSVVAKLVDTTRTTYVATPQAAVKLAVSASAGIAAADKITIGNEQLLVGAVDATVGGVTLTRAQHGSTGAAHVVDSVVYKETTGAGRQLNEAGNITDSQTSITLDDTTGIVDGATIYIDFEQILVTTVLSSTVLSVIVRGQGGSAAASHLDNATVYLRTTPGPSLYVATTSIATTAAFSTLAGLSDGDLIVIDTEHITWATANATIDGITVTRSQNSTSAPSSHVGGTAIFLVTDTTNTLYIATTAAATLLAFNDISGFADTNVLLIDAERITATTKNAAVTGSGTVTRAANSTTAAVHAAAIIVYDLSESGLATGSADSDVVVGEILSVYINFDAASPSTIDCTLKTKGNVTGVPSHNILVTTSTATDAVFHPRAKAVDNANSAITNSHAPFVVADKLTVSIDQADTGVSAVVVTVLYRDMS